MWTMGLLFIQKFLEKYDGNISILTSKSWIKVINMYMYFTIVRFYTVINREKFLLM